MWMRGLSLGLIIAASGVAPAFAEPARSVVAVLPLVDKTGLPADRVEALSDYLRIRVAALGDFDVVDKGLQEEETRRLVSEAKADSYRQCVDESCQIPLGRELAASSILRGAIRTVEGTTVLSLELIDVATATSKLAVSERVEGGEASMLTAIERASDSLAKRLRNEPAKIYGPGTLDGAPQITIYTPPPPVPHEPSTVAAIVYFSLAAASVAGGIALDVIPDSAHNGGLDFMDIVPVALYGTALILGLNGVSEL